MNLKNPSQRLNALSFDQAQAKFSEIAGLLATENLRSLNQNDNRGMGVTKAQYIDATMACMEKSGVFKPSLTRMIAAGKKRGSLGERIANTRGLLGSWIEGPSRDWAWRSFDSWWAQMPWRETVACHHPHVFLNLLMYFCFLSRCMKVLANIWSTQSLP